MYTALGYRISKERDELRLLLDEQYSPENESTYSIHVPSNVLTTKVRFFADFLRLRRTALRKLWEKLQGRSLSGRARRRRRLTCGCLDGTEKFEKNKNR
jgi:hypothetical protein